jgi:two-component system cell cycle sensor histidine kinase/response regulator CckA
MLNANVKSQLRLPGIALQRRIGLMQEALREKEKALEALHDSEKRYRRLFESAKDGILILDADSGKVVDVNPFLMRLLGYSYDDFRGKHIWEIGTFRDIASSKEAFKQLQGNEYIRYEDLPLETADGRIVEVEFVSNVYLVDHSKVIQCNIRDITARKQAEAERERLLLAIEQTGDVVVITDPAGLIQYVNPAFTTITGYSGAEALGQNPRLLKSGLQDEAFYRGMWATLAGGGIFQGRMINRRKDGTLYTEEATISPVVNAAGKIVNFVAVKRDITEQLRLAEQLQQAQKMESVGRLAGGVAHDFNNMLSVILGYTELAMDKLDPSAPLHDELLNDLTEILNAARHSTEITRQLLAFARQQIIAPQVFDLNAAVEGVLQMLRRLIGEDIDLAWLPGRGVWPVRMDVSQIDQILANLCVNARDAIADVGRITIETGTVTFDAAYCADHPGFVPGDFVLLAVSDDGCGMHKQTMDKLFEPFFTTKEVGKGTGLGLATVYGIVKQNNGFINVYSELSQGSTFKIYLARHAGEAGQVRAPSAEAIPLSRGETVLIVEDEAAILKLGRIMLEKLGYHVLAATAPGEAIGLAEAHGSRIDLLVTDLVMPEMNGRELADRLTTLNPRLKCLFMSGYTADVIAHHGVLDPGVCFMQKPYSLKDIALKVRQALSR